MIKRLAAPSAFLAAVACAPAPQTKPAEATTENTAYTEIDPARAGVVTGKVLFTGKAPPRQKVDFTEDPNCAKLHKGEFFNDAIALNKNGTLANVFIYVKAGLEGKKFRPPANPITITQKGCWFEPRMMGIEAGQPFRVINADPFTHNIHPRTANTREWNQSQDAGAEPLIRKFARAEIMVRIKCNIHPWMKAWVGVTEHPFHAISGNDGTFTIKNLPAGKYTIEAWQEELGTQQQEVTVTPQATETLSFTYKGE